MSESGPARSHGVFSQDEQFFPHAARPLLPAVSHRSKGSGASAGSGFDRSGSGRGSSQITETAWANPTEDRVPVAEGKGCLREEPSGLRGARSDA
jgi:hypothetical protein